MRFDVSANPVRLLLIAPIGGVMMFACLAFFSSGRLGRFGIEETMMGGIAGAVYGTLSVLFVLPLLTWTDIRRSVPLTYGGTILAAVIAGLFNIGDAGLIGVPSLHVLLCVASAVLLRKTERPAMTCPDCGYALRGLRNPRCPECGCDLTPHLRKQL